MPVQFLYNKQAKYNSDVICYSSDYFSTVLSIWVHLATMCEAIINIEGNGYHLSCNEEFGDRVLNKVFQDLGSKKRERNSLQTSNISHVHLEISQYTLASTWSYVDFCPVALCLKTSFLGLRTYQTDVNLNFNKLWDGGHGNWGKNFTTSRGEKIRGSDL